MKKLTHQEFLKRVCDEPWYKEYKFLSEYNGANNHIKFYHSCGYEGSVLARAFYERGNPCPCQFQLEIAMEKRKQTNLAKYGVEHTFQVPEFREKTKQTNLERYGVENPFQSKEVKEKIRQTNLERYGVEYISQCKEVKEKIKQTNLEKYGVEYATQSLKVKRKLSLTRFARFHGEEQVEILLSPNLLKELLQSRTFTTTELTKYFSYKNSNSILDILHKYDLYDLVSHKPEISSFHSDFLYHIPTDDINNRTVLDGLEIDCYYPEQKIGIELNGNYWHAENTKGNKDHKYHNHKTELAAAKGIRLIHIFEHQWYNEKDKWINYILNALGHNEERIYARETYVAEVSTADYCNLLNTHHLQSYAPASIKLGLYSKKTNELVFVMGFKKVPNSSSNYTLERMCSSVHTIGGATKCLSHFIKTYKPSSIETFCDTTTFTGGVYEKMGFTKIATTQPMYSWVNKNHEVIKRRSAQKANIIKKFNLPPETMNKTENEIMTELGYYKIWGCNLIKYKLIIPIEEKENKNI